MIKAYFIGGTLDQSTKMLNDAVRDVHALKISKEYGAPYIQDMGKAGVIVPAEKERYVNVGIQAKDINLEIHIYILEEYL